MKRLRLYLEQIENTVVMRVLEQSEELRCKEDNSHPGITENIFSETRPALFSKNLYIRGLYKDYDNSTVCKVFETKQEAKEYLQKVIGWLDDYFYPEAGKPKVGDNITYYSGGGRYSCNKIIIAVTNDGFHYNEVIYDRDTDSYSFIYGFEEKNKKTGYNAKKCEYYGEIKED